MQSATVTSREVRWTRFGDRWVGDDGERLEAWDLASGTCVSAEGTVRDALRSVIAGRDLPAWLANSSAGVRSLADALRGQASPLTRSDVLRGSGFELLFVELTARCNERCTHCYAESSPERTEQLSRAEVLRILREARSLGFDFVQFTGGDPLLHPDLVEFVGAARALDFGRVEIFTNGLSLSDALVDELEPHDVELAFSVYSDDAAAHDAVTGVPGSHTRTLRAIGRALSRGLRARVGVTVTGAHPEAAHRVRPFLEGLGLEPGAIRVTGEKSVGRGSVHGATGEGAHTGAAGSTRGKACISPRGEVFPCIFARGLPLGNVRDRALGAILGSEEPIRAALGVDDRYASAGARLTCDDCRSRDALLAEPAQRARLTVLTGVT